MMLLNPGCFEQEAAMVPLSYCGGSDSDTWRQIAASFVNVMTCKRVMNLLYLHVNELCMHTRTSCILCSWHYVAFCVQNFLNTSYRSMQVNNATARVMTNKKVANPYTNGKHFTTLMSSWIFVYLLSLVHSIQTLVCSGKSYYYTNPILCGWGWISHFIFSHIKVIAFFYDCIL